MNRCLRLASALAASVMLTVSVVPALAEIQKRASMCPGQKMCFWLKAVVAAPAGWREDEAYGNASFLTTFLPDKAQLGPDAPLIYVQVSLHQDNQTLDQNIAQNQSLWRKSEPKAKITALADVARGGDRLPFKVFLYENPTHPKQAFEMLAFTLETQPDGSHYIITVVDTASSRTAIDGSRDAYMAVLAGL
jgi:hypothetical protein